MFSSWGNYTMGVTSAPPMASTPGRLGPMYSPSCMMSLTLAFREVRDGSRYRQTLCLVIAALPTLMDASPDESLALECLGNAGAAEVTTGPSTPPRRTRPPPAQLRKRARKPLELGPNPTHPPMSGCTSECFH
eukprot:8945202-Alexandrium_andersonii.AAC.2